MTVTTQQLYKVLAEKFGFTRFRPGQLEALTALSEGRDTLAVLPTGAGKTLIYECYGYAVQRPVVIVSPLLSLMQDQVRALNLRGETAVTAVTSLMSFTEKRVVLQHLNRYRFIFSSPEMLTQPAFLTALKACQVGLLVVDEAHCISTWGPDFRPEYLLLGRIRNALGRPLTLMATATATPQVKRDILKKMQLPTAAQIGLSVDRTNIYLKVVKTATEKDKQTQLVSLVKGIKTPGIVYFSSRKTADEVCEVLRQSGVPRVAAYHGGLSADSRYKVQQQFMNDELTVICATNAFGMGIDKANIRFVIHYHLPVDLENYWQEIGRAGRDGQQSIAILLYTPGDERLPEYLGQANIVAEADIAAFFARPRPVADDDPLRLVAFYRQHHLNQEQVIALFASRRQQRRQALATLLTYVNTSNCRRRVVQAYFGDPTSSLSQNCCDRDSPETTVENLHLTAPPTSVLQGDVLPWRATLDQLFLGKS